MRIRPALPHDIPRLVDLTIETFGPFYEESFRPLVGEVVFANQHRDWREDYRRDVPALLDPAADRHVAVADDAGALLGYVAWNVDPAHRNGTLTHLAVDPAHRRRNLGAALCTHAFDRLRAQGAEVVEIGTGGDAFHAPARALYESLGCVALPLVVYYREL